MLIIAITNNAKESHRKKRELSSMERVKFVLKTTTLDVNFIIMYNILIDYVCLFFLGSQCC